MSQEVQGMLIRLEATTAQLRQEMARADATVAQVSGRIDRQLATVDSAFTRAGMSAMSASNMLRNAMGAAAGALSISSLVHQADAYASIASRLRLVTSSAAEFNAAQKAVFSIAQEAYQPLTATAELYQRIATNQKELKLTGEGVAGIVGTISKTMAISGASAASANAALIQLGQAFASGVLRGEELNSVMEQAPALAQAIAQGMGKTVGELRTLGQAGLLTADAVVKALQSQQKAVEDLYAKTAVTVDNSLTALGNSYTQLVGRLDQLGGVSSKVADTIVSMSKAMDSLTGDNLTAAVTFERISSVAETLAYVVGGRLALGLGQAALGFASSTKAAIQQAAATTRAIMATDAQVRADAAAAKQALASAESKHVDARAALARAEADILAAEQKVASDRLRQQSDINNLKSMEAQLIAERQLELQRHKAQISEIGRQQSQARIIELRQAEIATNKLVQQSEAALAETTTATSATVQAAYERRALAAGTAGETQIAVNAAVAQSERATAAATASSRALTAATAAGGGLMSLLSGPVGLIAMTALVAASFYDFSDGTEAATKALIDQHSTVEESIKKFDELGASQRRFQLITWAEDQIKALDLAKSTLSKYSADGAEAFLQIGYEANGYREQFKSMIEEVRKGQRTLDSVTEWAKRDAGLTDDKIKKLAESASAYEDSSKRAGELDKILNAVGGTTSTVAEATQKLGSAQAQAGGQTKAQLAEWDKYLAKLIETRDLIGANTEAEAKRRAQQMNLTAEQAKQAEIIARQTDVLKKIEDAVKSNDKTKQESLRKELVSLYTLEQAQKDSMAETKRLAEEAAKATTEGVQKIYDAQKQQVSNSVTWQIQEMARLSTAMNNPTGLNLLSGVGNRTAGPDNATRTNLSGYGLITNGGAPIQAAATPAVVVKTAGQRADEAMAQIVAGTTPNKVTKSDGEKLIEKQAKALEEFTKKAEIATRASVAMADAYLSGADNVRALTIAQEIEEELLKTGAASRAKVTAAINAQHDAQDRLEVSKTIASMRTEVEWLEKEARATLQGTTALEAYNIEKSMKAELAGKNIAVGSKEYEQLLAMTKAQLAANKTLDQANKANDIVDRLNPQLKLLKDYTAEQQALNAAMSIYPEKAALYQDALVKLGNEYEVNRSKATLWGQMTEAAIDRIDESFANAWANIGDGASTLWDDLKKGFKQTLGEIMHMLTTKPLLASISNWLTGTDNGQGLSSVWGKILGTAGGSSGGLSIGSLGAGSLAGIGKTLYQAWSTLTGVGADIAAGYATGGISGAVSGGVGYYTSMLSSVGASISSGFSSLMATITGTTATQTAAIVAAEGLTATSISTAAQAGASAYASQFGVAASTASYAAAESAAAAAAASSTTMMMGPLAILMGMYQSGKLYDAGVRYDTSDMQTSQLSQIGRMLPGMVGFDRALTFASIGLADRTASAIFGDKLGAILSGSTLATAVETFIGQKLFGTKWATKDTGLALSVTGGEFAAEDFQYQKKKGGLFGSNKKRWVYSEMADSEMADTLGAAYNSTVLGAMDLFAALNVTLNQAVLDGLNVERLNISTQDRTTEEIQADITAWFTTLGDSAVAAINTATSATLDGLTFEDLQTLVNNLYSVNASLDLMGVKAAAFSVSGARIVESLVNAAGDIDTLNANINSYYAAFTSETQQANDSIKAVRLQFAALGIQLPVTEDAFRTMLQAIDVTTEAGRATFTAMTANASAAASVYATLQQRQADYYSAFHTEAENTARSIADTTAEIKKLGVTLPETRAQFRAMVEAAQKDTSAAGQALLESLLSVAAAAGTVFDALEATAQETADAIAAANANYWSLFASEAQQSAVTLQTFTDQMQALGLALPASRAGFVALVDSIDTTTAAGQSLFNSLMGVATEADAAFKVLEAQVTATNAALLASATAGLSAVQRAISAEQTAVTEAYNAKNASFSDMLTTVTEKVSDLSSVSSALGTALDALNGTSSETVAQLRAQAQATLQAALTKARAGESLGGLEGLEDALSTVSSNDTGLYASLEDFNREQGRTANVVAELNTLNGKQLTSAEKTVESLQKQIDAAKAAYDLQLEQFDSQLAQAQAQLDALNGIDNSVMTVAAAMQAMNTAVVAALAGQATGAAAQNTYDNNVALLESVYQRVLGRSLDASGKATWTAALANGTVTYDNLVQTIAAGGRLNGEMVKIPGFATGGDFAGGMRLVGENGPELEVTGPSRIFNAEQTSQMLAGMGDGQATAQEVRELRAELKAALFAIAKYTMKTANNTDLLPRKLEEDLFS